MKYCTYLTIYKGNKLPPFYIGSTSIDRIQSGYKGTVSSKQYKHVWKEELSNNPHLFKTIIVSIHLSRAEAYEKEFFLQEELDVCNNSLYINCSIWKLKQFVKSYNFHSEETKLKISKSLKERDLSGCNHPMYGKQHTIESKTKMSNTHKANWRLGMFDNRPAPSEESKQLRSQKYRGEDHPRYGKSHSEETKLKISKAKKGKKLNLSPEERNRRSKSKVGRKVTHTNETKAKLSSLKTKFFWLVEINGESIRIDNFKQWCHDTFDNPNAALSVFRSGRSYKGIVATKHPI